jgi:hypothetical protein
MMLLELGLIFFVLLGSKVLLGVVAVYMLLPQDPRCVTCDDVMLPLVAPRPAARLLSAVGLQRRWCMECRREALVRMSALRAVGAPRSRPVSEARLR